MIDLAEKVVRETYSTCPFCYRKIKAYLIERDKKIYMTKQCPIHGACELLVSNNSRYYRNLTEYYFEVMPEKMRQKRYYIYLSNRCNLNCPICLLEPNQGNIMDMSLFEAREVISKNKDSRFYLYGAEPTLRNDLVQWIRLLKRHGNLVNMHTNGIKLTDYEYLKTLKDCGLDYVSLQFDGFNDRVYNSLRGRSLLDLKLKALDNLRKLNIQTGLNVTIARGINETQIKPIIDYALDNHFIKDVSFATLSFLGSANKNFSQEVFIMPDELIDMTEEQTCGKISRDSIFLFQKLYYALLSFLNIRRCFNFQHIALVRDKTNGFYTFDTLLGLRDLEKGLDIYKELIRKKNKLAKGYFLYTLFLNSLRGRFFEKLSCIPFNMFMPGKIINIKIPPKILLVSFGTVCDFYKYDSQIAQYCGQGFCFQNYNNVVLTDSISDLSLFYNKVCK